MKNTALTLVKKLRQAGHEAYWAGGCVRDMLMEREPKDYDIVTSARPEEVQQLLPRHVAVGKQFGVIVALEGEHKFEIATFRRDSSVSDGRRPQEVFFSSAEEDARRRDFTINGMFYDPIKHEVIDHVGGQEDLKHKVIRFIGDPDLRIREDWLRLLRAVRFKVTLGFTYDHLTARAMEESAQYVTKPSGERIRDELIKMLEVREAVLDRDPPYTFDLPFLELDHMGLLTHVLPEIAALKLVMQPPEYHAEGDVFVHTMRALHSLHLSASPEVVFGVLLHDVGKLPAWHRDGDKITFHGHEQMGVEIGKCILERLRFSTYSRDKILWLIANHMLLNSFERMKPARRRTWFMNPGFLDLLKVMKADSIATKPTELSDYNRLSQLYHEEKERKLLTPPKPFLTGTEIMELFNLAPGPQIGEILEFLHDAQLEGRVKDREEAVEMVRERMRGATAI